jgi:cyclic pyranopterin phosphate synthase
MDVGGATGWSLDKVVSRAELLSTLAARVGPVEPLPARGSAPAERFRLPDGRVFGIVASTTAPFCAACDRARLTADGTLFTCLYAHHGLDLRELVRRGDAPESVEEKLRAAWGARADRGAEERVALRDARGPLFRAQELRSRPHLEMHTRGG